jgi:hypothetical protein
VTVGQGEPLALHLDDRLVLGLDLRVGLGRAALVLPGDDGGALGGAVLAEDVGQVGPPLLLHRGQGDAVLRAAGARNRRLDRGQIQVELGGVLDRLAVVTPQPLGLVVLLDRVDQLVVAAGHLQVLEDLVVDREEADRGAVLGGHVGDRGPVGDGHVVEAGAEELHELPDHAVGPEHLRDPEHQVGGGGALRELAGEAEADDLGQQHVDRLADHGGLGLDAADAPAEHAEAVDHRGVRVGPHQAVRVEPLAVVPGDLGKVLQVDLVDDAGGRGHDTEVGEGGLAPLQELVSLAVPLELHPGVDDQGVGPGVGVHLHRVVDDQVGGDERVDLLGGAGVTGHADDGLAHRRQVDDRGDAREVLQHHAARDEGDLLGARVGGVVGGDSGDVLLPDGESIQLAEGGLEQDADRVRKPLHAVEYVESGHRPGAERSLDHLASPERIVGHVSLSGFGCQ